MSYRSMRLRNNITHEKQRTQERGTSSHSRTHFINLQPKGSHCQVREGGDDEKSV